jgi:hypothetical protein
MDGLFARERADRLRQRFDRGHRRTFDQNRDHADVTPLEGGDKLQSNVVVRLIESPASLRVARVEPLASDHRDEHAAVAEA